MRQVIFALGILGLAFSMGCGSGNNGRIVVPKGNFSNASLSGSYVYQIVGNEFITNANPTGLPYRESGVLTADGNGHVTSGTDDFVEGPGGPTPTSITGTYTIGNDGIGTVTLSTGTNIFITLVSSSNAYLIEADAGLNASGLLEKQDATAISSIPSGSFAFHLHTLNASLIPSARVGAMTITNATVSGNEDLNNNGSSSTPAISSGSLGTPTSGRGDASINDGSGSVNFKYYIVDANNIRFLASDSGIVGGGSAEKQSGTLALSGSYAFGSRGDTQNFIGGVNSVGRFTTDGVSTITSGLLDSVHDGTQTINGNFTGTFTPVAINGRIVLTLAGVLAGTTEVVYLVSPSRGFFLSNAPNKVEDGTLDLQLTSTFSNSTLNGQFAFVTDGFDTSFDFIDRVGTMNWNGSGSMTFHEAVNSGTGGGLGAQLLGFFSATYSVDSNNSGRATAIITNVSLSNNDFVFYLVSGNDTYVLENDAGVEISGVASKQR